MTTAEEAKAEEVAREANHNDPRWLGDIIVFAMKTCRRLRKITVLKRRNFYFDVHGAVFLVTERTKNKKRVRIPLRGVLAELVKRRLAAVGEDGYVFPGPQGRKAEMAIKRYFPKAVQAAGLEYGRGRDQFSFHSLRHSGASIMANDGVPVEVIQLIGGWKDRRVVERYAHLGDRRLAAAMEQLDGPVSGTRTSQYFTMRPSSEDEDTAPDPQVPVN